MRNAGGRSAPPPFRWGSAGIFDASSKRFQRCWHCRACPARGSGTCSGVARNSAELQDGGGRVLSDLRFLWDHDAPYHEMYQGTAAVRIYRWKQDTGRKGHLPRLGRASNVEWDLVLRLQRYAERHGLEVSAECSKDEDPGAGCRHCPPFFFTERPGERRGTKIREPI